MSEKYYSTNEEVFDHRDMEDAVREVFDYVGAKAGDERVIFEGMAKKLTAGDFAPDIVDQLSEAAYCECEEFSEGWLEDLTPDERSDLAARVKATVNAWADDHAKHPQFFTVENVREIKVRLLSDEGDEFEEV